MATFTQNLKAWAARLGRAPAARQHLRRFDGAAVNRLTESWLASQASIDQELRGDLDRLRRRSRDLAKNNEYMAKFLRMVRNNVIGQGVGLQSRPMDGAKIDNLAAAAIERHWAEWVKPSACDVTGRAGLWTLLRAAVDALARDGELLLRLRRGRGAYGLQLQLLDVERLDTAYNVARVTGQNAIVMGVEVDEFHRPVAYHILQTLPGGSYATQRTGERERVPAADIIHRFLQLEPEQTRGVPWAHAAMRRLNDIGGYREAAVIAARIGASKMGFFTTPEPDQLPQDGKDAQGVPYTSATPGEFGVLPAGVGFQQFDPAYPHEQFGEFMKAALRGVASGLGVSYNTLANDLEGVNFSSIRSGVLEERDEWMVLQDWVTEQVLDPIFDEWLRIGLAGGLVTQISSNGASPLPLAKRAKFAQRVWMPRRWGWVDPLKDVQATVLAIEANLTTATDAAARAGVDIEDVFATKQREEEMKKQYGIKPPQAAPTKPGRPAAGAANDDGEDDPADDSADDAATGDQGRALTNPEMANMIQLARRSHRAGQTVELSMRVEAPPAPPAAPVINVAAPVVHVAAPNVAVQVQPTPVNVEAPNVSVEAIMPAANVTVHAKLPPRRHSSTVERDSAGRILNTTTIETDLA
jgi:lambda family phage portal protein